MSFFWVNIGSSYKEVKEQNFLWAPQYGMNKNGQKFSNASWEAVKGVKAGDVIFCNKDREIVYVATATGDAEPAPRPLSRSFDKWEREGTRVDIELTVLEHPIDVSQFSEIFMSSYNESSRPSVFAENGSCTQTYMCEIPEIAAKMIASFISENVSIDFNKETAKVKEATGSTKETIIQARVGHGPYREKLFKKWGGKCAVTGVALESMLTASHIVSWSISNDKEKVDPYNGFLLIPNLDRLFDRGMISFDDNGHLLHKKEFAGLLRDLKIPLDSKIDGLFGENKKYLKRHRVTFGFEKE
ncbi:HNH endonuclease [Serratia fonticola]|uniref:HNH endonuclease n=1 Tax=Serratia fonticola TaxID=47917 RepID=UPI0015C5995E|nr:HNH endonuclease signature motif containing protein [Serratia fonticola]MBC3378455.1 HNH endonuclease [Serratia fonticola]NYA37655.1 HNH endonuclease [Serratia fonticola]